MTTKKKILALCLMVMILGCTGCTYDTSTTITGDVSDSAADTTKESKKIVSDSTADIAKESKKIVYEAMMYDNQGNNFLNFEGNNFTITPNKVKQYGWDSDGSWMHYYETSSVVTIEIDGNYIQSCGSTVIFKDKRLEMLDIPSELNTVEAGNTDSYTVKEDKQGVNTYLGLRYWWYDIKEQGQNGEKIVLIQSQDGYNIGAFVGNDVTWGVAEKLPKTTKLMIDGLPVYIHRCNFTIIDSALITTSFDKE